MNYFKYFYTFTSYKVVITEIDDEIGDKIKTYTKGDSFKCDMQPLSNEEKEKTWGEDIEVNKNMYCDTSLNTGDFIIYKDKPYKIVNSVDWENDNKLYALQEVDIKCS